LHIKWVGIYNGRSRAALAIRAINKERCSRNSLSLSLSLFLFLSLSGLTPRRSSPVLREKSDEKSSRDPSRCPVSEFSRSSKVCALTPKPVLLASRARAISSKVMSRSREFVRSACLSSALLIYNDTSPPLRVRMLRARNEWTLCCEMTLVISITCRIQKRHQERTRTSRSRFPP